MSAPVNIKGAYGGFAAVEEGALVVSSLPVPAYTDKILSLPYANFLTVNGAGVVDDLRVAGSLSSPVIAEVKAEAGADIYITEIKVIIAATVGGNGMALSQFGGIDGGVTNGFIPFFSNKGAKLQVSERPLFTNLDFIRIGSAEGLGADDTAFRVKGAKNSTGYAYLPVWDMRALSSGNGVRLSAGSKQSFGVEIRDDITSLDGFEILAVGFRRFV